MITLVLLFSALIITTIDFSWSNLLSNKRNDIVFETKFKEYGAYKIRKSNSKVLGISLISTIFIVVSGFTFPMLLKEDSKVDVRTPNISIVEMIAPPIDEIKQKIIDTKKVEKITTNQSSLKFTEIEVVDNEIDEIKTQDELENQNISKETIKGEIEIIMPKEEVSIIEEKEEIAVTFAQEMPIYPGGEIQMQKDIIDEIVYHEMEKENGISGKVYVQFVVEKDGSITNVHSIRGVPGGPNLEKAAELSVKKLKNFTPAKQNGRAVRLVMTIPVNFNLK